MVSEMSGRKNIVGRNVQSGKYPSRNCPSGSVSLGNVHEEVSVGELLGREFISETFSEELL